MAVKIEFGTVSHGTLRNEDLVNAFSSELSRICDSIENADFDKYGLGMKECLDLGKLIGRAELYAEVAEDADLADAEFPNELIDALDRFAPPYGYFGAHEGDGSDFGFWPSLDAVDDAVKDGSAVKVGCLDDVPDDWDGDVFVVSDHGNLSLYRLGLDDWREVWGIV